MNKYALLNTAWSDYDSIITTQREAFWEWPWEVFWIRLNIAWTEALIKVFTPELPTWDTVLMTWDNSEDVRNYIAAHDAEWNEPI